MTELVKKLYLAGVGALALTKEKIESLTDELIKRGEIAASEKSSFINELVNTVEKTRTETQNIIKKEVQKILSSLELPTRQELEELKQKVAELENKTK